MKFRFKSDHRLRFFLGDVRDLDRLKVAFRLTDFVIHTAALKQVETGEYNPFEFIKTNVLGSQNVIEAAIEAGVKKVIALSTDKASSPVNLYGATKLTADKLFVAANNYGFKRGTAFSVVRYGNVIGSRGSILPLFRELAAKGLPIPITDERMTRFWLSMHDAVNFVISSLENMSGGELFVPQVPSIKIIELAKTIAPNSEIEIIGIRAGEKIHEEMISADDSRRTLILSDRFLVIPSHSDWGFKIPKGKYMTDGQGYRSDTNTHWLTGQELLQISDLRE
jgi:UDP-N-acetylglucosamine 4,6-dehydratase